MIIAGVKVPSWALYGAAAIAAYAVYRAVTNPEKVGEAAGSAAVGIVAGVAKGAGAAIKGAVDGTVQALRGDNTSTLGTWIYDFLHPDDGKIMAPPQAVKVKKTDTAELDAWLRDRQNNSPYNAYGLETFATVAGFEGFK